MLTFESQNKTFFEQLQTTKGIDLRDKRGLKHEMALVLVGVTLSLLCNRDGSLSSIHRHMNNTFEILRTKLNSPNIVVISRSQLPQVLMRVNLSLFEALLFKNYGVVLSEDEKKWFSIDGKELRGSIEKGNKRGEAIVLAVSHQNRVIQAQGYYSGDKESEIPTVRTVLKENKLDNQKISMDAIHCNPETLSQINQKKGIYLVGLKGNQGEFLQDCTDFVRFNKADFTLLQEEIIKPKHGRQEIREYQVFDISKEERDKRGAKSQISTLIEVK